ncbi:TPA: glycerol-3-phosphate 1-O-acyltransferase PlsY [Enterococcus faecium]|uniref:glycerol-3-phosphate 1-O-acyltransferase PlsY n=1 Tax=Enterococcus sp. E5-37 TaxID=2996024 RepID=UPI00280D9668|nr:glycerol-3-phosphate 1-O-acyltransferase PlsY [Enterococcus sp. E5-37]EME8211617.1 glycerol-3-phosphate 1-O-acyltransferase PlsY [Enterococcus faecium]MDQ8333137.1 glycerol-3-phosphate 1-O-acyltransferase PlsY [Enterococcus faecium]MEB4608966.1 glycerol-3-phosphate 1-O-acyltransferase PlsY [Enterococcus sp. E5-37]HAR1309552.1 glycerol-3-phosphate 1-O-acyltransferase PlsY [Enterococcus faecium]HAR1311071.1 glycerol-3-phosphate 1-O-acyltransferase PlsY [Enterococcus faecium]
MKLILLLILAYLLGSIPSGVWIGKLFFKKDIRQHGSGNTGTTNTFRVLGKKAGIVVLLMDILKGTLATCLPMIFHLSGINPLWFGVCAILGHTFPIFAGFKGGKAVATSAGMLLGFNPVFFVYSCIIFIVSLFCTSMVSLSSMISAVLITLSTIVLPYVAPVILAKPNWLLTIIAFLVSSFIFYRHKDNIKRIRNHTESRIPFGLNSSKKKS